MGSKFRIGYPTVVRTDEKLRTFMASGKYTHFLVPPLCPPIVTLQFQLFFSNTRGICDVRIDKMFQCSLRFSLTVGRNI